MYSYVPTSNGNRVMINYRKNPSKIDISTYPTIEPEFQEDIHM